METKSSCRICDNYQHNVIHKAREMFFGTRAEFDYLDCANCGTLQLLNVPDLAKYYPSNYYSFDSQSVPGGSAGPGRNVARFARRLAAEQYYSRNSKLSYWIGNQIMRLAPRLVAGFPEWLRNAPATFNLKRTSAILDVGAGAGATLKVLREFGFTNLTGVDPFIERDVNSSGIRLLKTTLNKIAGCFELILLNHSLEHVADPRDTLRHAYRLLVAGGYAIIRTPIKAKAWQAFGTDWVQLDPPRHLFIFTKQTLEGLIQNVGFEIVKTRFDSGALQFWGSKQYQRGIALNDDRSYLINPGRSIFSREEIANFEAEAANLNAEQQGDQATLYLYKPAA